LPWVQTRLRSAVEPELGVECVEDRSDRALGPREGRAGDAADVARFGRQAVAGPVDPRDLEERDVVVPGGDVVPRRGEQAVQQGASQYGELLGNRVRQGQPVRLLVRA